MKIEDITRPVDYHFSRKLGATVISGKGEVQAKTYIPHWGWLVLLHDKARDKVWRLRPAHILRRARVR